MNLKQKKLLLEETNSELGKDLYLFILNLLDCIDNLESCLRGLNIMTIGLYTRGNRQGKNLLSSICLIVF